MRPTDIERWAHELMDRVEAGHPNEDTRVELKRDWIDGYDMARRLAGHANAARTDRILWLIGVDEKQRNIPGVSARDAASWYPTVVSSFEGFAPGMTDLAVRRGNATAMALVFDTDRPPYLVKNPAFGKEKTPIQYEVPWREGTSVRTARREDLFRILVPQARLPECEVRRASNKGGGRGPGAPPPASSLFLIWLYVVPVTNERLYVPFHRCAARIRTPGRDWVRLSFLHFEEDASGTRARPPGPRRPSHTIAASETELVIDGAGGAVLIGTFPLLAPCADAELGFDATLDFAGPLEIELALSVAGVDGPVRVQSSLEPGGTKGSDEGACWVPRTTSVAEFGDAVAGVSETFSPENDNTA